MGRVIGETLLVQLALVEAVHEQLQSGLQRLWTARKTTRSTSQTCQIMTQLGIIGFHRVGVPFTIGDFIHAPVIPQLVVDIESVTVVALRFWRLVNQLLTGGSRSMPHHLKTQVAAGEAIYNGDDVDFFFFSPMKVNNSSISASLTSEGVGGSGSWAARACTHKETVR